MLNPIRCRPMHGLLAALPTLPAGADGRPDYEAADTEVLRALGEHAEDCMRVAQSGLQGIGTLLVHAAPETEAGSIGGEVVEAIGHLLSELGALAGHCLILAAACRTQLAAREAPGSTATARARRKKRLPSTV
ncbi:MAG: hypothetical protein AB1807_26005 [Pseudomonadota bacterium]